MALPTRVPRSQVDFPFETLRDLDTLMRGVFGREGGGQAATAAPYTPYGVDIREDADHIYVEAELPGFKKEEIDVTLENSTLTIAAERRVNQEEKKGEWLLNERRYARFLRSFTLPPTVDESSVQAKLNEGILTITINKREESKPKKVKVG